jgi:cytochrome b involved in lipid metabolism/ferredoxin-NADP reductase
VRGAGLNYHPGDRCCVLPENTPAQIARTLAALRADGGELVGLNMIWRQAIAAREGYADKTELPLRDLLRFGELRPLARPIARALYRATGDRVLRRIIEARAADQWELWDVLELLSASGFDPRSLWRAHSSDHESICWIVPPLRPRLYSIASVADGQVAEELHLTVGSLRYETLETDISLRAERTGTASSYLVELAEGQRVVIKLVHPPRFCLPADPTRPIVMIAGGTGLAPFRSFILARARHTQAGPAWLFFATRNRDELYYADELAQHVADRRLIMQVAFSREDSAVRFAHDDDAGARLVLEPGRRRRIDELLLQPDNAALLCKLLSRDADGATFYVCGRADFAASVQRAIRALLAQQMGGTSAAHTRSAALHFRALMAEGRYHEEVYTSYAGPVAEASRQIDASELVLHNDAECDAWIAISGRVYDMTEFLHLHPGGLKILQANLGMDATRAYRQVQHHVRPEVDALLAMYAIGVVRRLDFGAAWAIVIGEQGPRFTAMAEAYKVWVRVLYLVVEMENALRLDFTIQQRALVGGEPAAARSPYKLRLMLEIHQRFLANCLRGLAGEPLHELWTIACGLGGQDRDIGWMRQALDAIVQGEVAQATDALVSILEDESRDESGAGRGHHVADALGALECADRLFLHELKLVLREGLRVFETYQHKVAPQGGTLLVDICRRLPRLYTAFFDRAAKALG